MKEVNYNETIVIPLLQRKFQELMNANLILEASLLVEQEKNKHLQEELAKLEVKIAKKKKGDPSALDGETY